jgi:hypothetical protein
MPLILTVIHHLIILLIPQESREPHWPYLMFQHLVHQESTEKETIYQ